MDSFMPAQPPWDFFEARERFHASFDGLYRRFAQQSPILHGYGACRDWYSACLVGNAYPLWKRRAEEAAWLRSGGTDASKRC